MRSYIGNCIVPMAEGAESVAIEDLAQKCLDAKRAGATRR